MATKRRIQRQRKRKDSKDLSNDFMPFEELAGRYPGGRVQLYQALRDGVVPSIRVGRRFHILRAPTERILRGEIPPGGQASREQAATPLRRKRDERSALSI